MKTKRSHKFIVIGNPIAHSLSPTIHQANFQSQHLHNCSYEKVLVEDIRDIRNLALRNSIEGFNVTLPWKEKVIPMLDEIHLPEGVCAVNTVTVDLKRKHFVGYNTDIYGILEDLQEKQVVLDNKKLLVLGYGGLGKTLASVFKKRGSVEIFRSKHQVLAKRLQLESVVVANRSFKDGVDIVANASKMLEMISGFDVVINTASIHAFDDICLEDAIPKGFNGVFYDCTPMKTSLVEHINASTNGRAFDGRGMLVHQAAKSFEIWTGKKADLEAMKKSIGA